MHHLLTLVFYGALLLGLTAGLHRLKSEPAPVAPAVSFAQSADTVEAYDFVEITLTVPKPTAKNPFTDVAVTGKFRRGESAPVAVQGFCDSADGGTYRIRFMPSKPGKHAYQVTFRQGDAERTHTGTFEATDGKRRGSVQVDKEHPWHFVWEGTGEHYFFNGNTAFWLMGWKDENIIKAALDRMHRLKINRVRVLVSGTANVYWGEPLMTGDNFTYFLRPWIAAQPQSFERPGNDYTRFNVSYWQKWERMLRHARDQDTIISAILDISTHGAQPAAGSEDERRYIRYALARLSAFSNITWDLGDDLDSYRNEKWTHETGTFIHENDPYRRLATSHPVHREHQDRASAWFGFTSIQEWSRRQHELMLEERQIQLKTGRIIPQTNEEYGYEDHYPLWAPKPPGDSADVLRRTAWDIAMAGAYGTAGETVRRGVNIWPNTGGGWINGRGDDTMVMLRGYAHMVDFFTGFEWWKADPHDELVNKGAYCLAEPGRSYAVYLPHGGKATVQLKEGRYQANWFDPRSGKSKPLPPVEGPNWTSPESPDGGDWALLLRKNPDKEERSAITEPLRQSKKGNYFEDATGAPLILCGSHTWNTLQDWGTNGTVRPLDFDAFVAFLKAHGHNFTLLWFAELPQFTNLPSTEPPAPVYTVSPFPWKRTGPGKATDGGLKFDLSKFDQAYFDRLRARTQALNEAGIYAGVYVFSGEWQLRFRCPTDGYPFSGTNNVNGVDDGYRGGTARTGLASVTMTAPNAITKLQDAYVKKTIDTLNDLPNVLWIVSQEAPPESEWWNAHLISLIRTYEKGKRWQHPIGLGMLDGRKDSTLYQSEADWVAPGARISPPHAAGTKRQSAKVTVNDSDHSYYRMWNDTAQVNRNYAWQNFTNGHSVLFMDPYLVYYPRQKRNLCLALANGIGSKPDPRWENFRDNLGYLVRYARKLNLASVASQGGLCSTGFCLAQTPAAGAEYLAYAPHGGSFTLNLSAMPRSRKLAVEWFNPATGKTISENPIAAGSSSQSFTPPFSGDAVLYLVDTAGHNCQRTPQ